MKQEPEVMYKNRKFVTRARFCELVGISISSLKRYTGKGIIRVQTINGLRGEYIDLEYGRKEIELLANMGGRKKQLKNFAKVGRKAEIRDVAEPSIPDADVMEIRGEETVDLDKIDRTKYADCLNEYNEFDYDRLKARLTAETYEFKLEKEKGLHIPKQEIMRSAKAIASIVKTNMEAIPSRYTAAFIALAESYSGYQFTNEQKTELRNRLKDVAPQIMVSIQSEIRNLVDDE
jgi:hypothetical protein